MFVLVRVRRQGRTGHICHGEGFWLPQGDSIILTGLDLDTVVLAPVADYFELPCAHRSLV